MTTKNLSLPHNKLLDWAEGALPGDSYVYWSGDAARASNKVFGEARKLAEHGLFVLFTKGHDRLIIRTSQRASRFLQAASRW